MTSDDLNQLENNLRAAPLNIRIKALNQLAQQSAAEAMPVLQRLLQEPEFLLRRLAVMGLGNQAPDQQAFEMLENLIANETDNNVLAEVANALYEFGSPSIPLLVKIFETNDNWLVRQTILSILQEANHDEILLNVAIAALKDPTQTVKETAILSLRQVLMSPLQDQAMAQLNQLAHSDIWRDRWRSATALTGCDHPQAGVLLAQLQTDENHYVVAAALDAAMGSGL